jgi:hypothetical protein
LRRARRGPQGESFRLYGFQGQFLAAFDRVRPTAEKGQAAPAFVYRRGLLVGPQGIGKNPLVAAQVCLEAVGPALFAGFADKDDGYACADNGCGCGWQYAHERGEPMGTAWPTPLVQITGRS